MDSDDVVLPKQGIERLTLALEGSRNRTEQQLSRLEEKIDRLSRDLTSVESGIRRDLQSQFVLKTEYEAHHKIYEAKLEGFERHVVGSEQGLRELAIARVEIEQLQDDYKGIDDRQRGAIQRAAPLIAVLLSFLGVLWQILQHIQFH